MSTFVKAFYDTLINACGDINNIKGTTTTALCNMRDGKVKGVTTTTITNILAANGMSGEFLVHTPKQGKTKIKL